LDQLTKLHFVAEKPPRRAGWWWRHAVGLAFVCMGLSARALQPTDQFGLKELEAEPNLTPAHFADLFRDFSYDYSPYIQAPDAFLRNRAGDCDDYAVLANHILSRQGFQTRVIRVELVGTRINHVICYVAEKKGYLDFNNRKYSFNLERSGASLRQIASKVADSFERNWSTVTEYTYSYVEGRHRTVYTVVKTESPERDPDQLAPKRAR
jgi:hypothetical protein